MIIRFNNYTYSAICDCAAILLLGVLASTYTFADTNVMEQDKKALAALRSTYTSDLAACNPIDNDGTYAYVTLARDISRDIVSYVANIIHDVNNNMSIEKPCQICVFAMGSLAREESGPYTDLEIGILLEEKTIATMEYADALMQVVSDRISRLEEHKTVKGSGLRLDEGAHIPPFIWNGQQYGNRLYVATPHEFACHWDPDFIHNQSNKTLRNKQYHKRDQYIQYEIQCNTQYTNDMIVHYAHRMYDPLTRHENNISREIVDTSRDMRYVWGDNELLDAYYAYRNAILDRVNADGTTNRTIWAYDILDNDIVKFSWSILNGNDLIPGWVDIKRDLYRFPQTCISTLGLLFHTQSSNSYDILHELYQRNVINIECFRELADYMNSLIGLRLRQEYIAQRQVYNIPTDIYMYKDKYNDITNEIAHLTHEKEWLKRHSCYNNKLHHVKQQLRKKQAYLTGFKKLKPEHSDSILTPEMLDRINTRLLPIVQYAYRSIRRFESGNNNALLEWDEKHLNDGWFGFLFA